MVKQKNISAFLNESGVLLSVEKPSRYIGNEYNAIRKKWREASLKYLLVFPDIYDIGMSHLGTRILYDIINAREDLLAERAYLPWMDMLDVMEEEEIPAFSIENKKPAGEFDIIGFSLLYELSYPGIVKFLELSKIPVYSKDRDSKEYPLIIGGGPCVFNPEPVAPFFDAFLIGDGEEAVLEISDCIREHPNKSREEQLLELAKIKGVYVPRFYQYKEGSVLPKREYQKSVPDKIEKRVAPLKKEAIPIKQIVPYLQTVHDRGVVEVLRGCTRGCRFCHAGMVYRPVRERSKDDIVQSVNEIVENTGYEEISLLSLSTLDHTSIDGITGALVPEMKKKRISLSIPSSRADRFGVKIAERIASLRKTGLTIAPEAGSQRMRDRINKNIRLDDILEMVESAKAKGWKRIKLYFMAGLPGETEEDLDGIYDIVKRVKAIGIRKISVSVSGFIPKPHTPFQYSKQANVEELHQKLRYLSGLKKLSSYEFHKPEISFVEGVLSRGDRDLAGVIREVSANGGYLEAWRDRFDYARWQHAFEKEGIDPCRYTEERQFDKPLPWDHIDSGLGKHFLEKELKKSEEALSTPDCRDGTCTRCGVCYTIEEAKEQSPIDLNQQ